MVQNCANPICHAEFSSLNSGDLYALERHSMPTEFFWLCPVCAGQMTLAFDALGEISVCAQADAQRRTPPRPDRDLRRVSFRTDTKRAYAVWVSRPLQPHLSPPRPVPPPV